MSKGRWWSDSLSRALKPIRTRSGYLDENLKQFDWLKCTIVGLGKDPQWLIKENAVCEA